MLSQSPVPLHHNVLQIDHWSLVHILGQIFNETQNLGGKFSNIGDLVNELRAAMNEDSDQDIIDSFADFLQVMYVVTD